LDALEDVVEEKSAQEEIKKEEVADAKAKAEVPVDTANPEAMFTKPGEIMPFDQARGAFGSEQEVIDFLQARTGTTPERVQELLNPQFDVTPAQAIRIAEMTEPPTPFEQADARLVGPVFGTIYFKDPKNPSFGYKFIDDQTVQFVKKDGTVVKKKFGPETPQYTEAVEYYELSKQK